MGRIPPVDIVPRTDCFLELIANHEPRTLGASSTHKRHDTRPGIGEGSLQVDPNSNLYVRCGNVLCLVLCHVSFIKIDRHCAATMRKLRVLKGTDSVAWFLPRDW